MRAKGWYVVLLLVLCVSCVEAKAYWNRMKAEQLLEKARVEGKGNRMVYFAKQLKGTPYKPGTLDANDEEEMVVRLDSVDCMTFVETVLALALCDEQDRRDFGDLEQQLQQIRYRGGKIEGYASRLHYFTDWIEDNTAKGLVEEKTTATKGAKERVFDLNFMSEHRSVYRALETDDEEVEKIREMEARKKGYHMPYIPKEMLDGSAAELDIEDGDILAVTTNIDGLDVVHTGIAYWMGGKLHMIHASLLKKKVIVDSESLYDYLKDMKRGTGVRVVRKTRGTVRPMQQGE